MLQCLYLGLCCATTACLRNYKKTCRKVTLFLIVLYVIVLMCFSYTNNDTNIYKNIIYIGSKDTFWDKDIGFGLLLQIGYFFGFSYETFRFFIYLLAILLIHFGVSKILKKYENLFWLIYCLYPLFLDNIETRNFLAYSILIFALPFLFEKRVSKKTLFFMLFVVACLIHKIIFIYAIPMLAYPILRTEKKSTRMLIDALFILLCVLGVNKNIFISILNSLPSWFQSIPGISRNLVTTNNNGWIVNLVTTVAFYFSVRVMYSEIVVQGLAKGKVSILSLRYKFCRITYVFGVFGSMLAPFYMISGDYMRVIRNLYAVTAIAILAVFECVGHSSYKINLAGVSLTLLIIAELIGVASIFYSNEQEALIYDIFVNNYIFNLGKLRYTWDDRPWVIQQMLKVNKLGAST